MRFRETLANFQGEKRLIRTRELLSHCGPQSQTSVATQGRLEVEPPTGVITGGHARIYTRRTSLELYILTPSYMCKILCVCTCRDVSLTFVCVFGNIQTDDPHCPRRANERGWDWVGFNPGPKLKRTSFNNPGTILHLYWSLRCTHTYIQYTRIFISHENW